MKRATLGMELAIVLDITGSMGRTFLGDGKTLDTSQNINAMRSAATNLVNIVFGPNETTPNLFASVTTFTASVNIGKQYTNWLKPGSLDQSKYSTSGWAGCVEARTGGEDQTDTPPTSAPFFPYLYKSTLGVYTYKGKPEPGDNDWSPGNITEQNEATLPDNTAVGPNLACSATAIQPLTAKKSDVMAVINKLVSTYRGGTDWQPRDAGGVVDDQPGAGRGCGTARLRPGFRPARRACRSRTARPTCRRSWCS